MGQIIDPAKNIISRNLSVHQEHELLLKLETAGLTGNLAQKIINSKGNNLAAKMVRLVHNEGFGAINSQKRASEIMGKNFFGPGAWLDLYGVNFTKEQLQEIDEFPWSEDILNSTCPLCGEPVKNCHFAFLGISHINGKPLTILELQRLHPDTGQPKFYNYNQGAWNSEKFTKETTMDFRWYLLHKNIIPGSENKTYNDQKEMLAFGYEVPSAVTEITKDLLIFQRTGQFVNSLSYARCKCVTLDILLVSFHVAVGNFDEWGLNICDSCGDNPSYPIGLAASRKPMN